MNEQFSSSYSVAELAISALKKLGLAASPPNIEVWTAHIEGSNPALSDDIQQCLANGGSVTQEQADAIYERHIVRAGLARDLLDLVTRFEAEVSDLFDTIEETGANAQGHDKKLSAFSGQLRQMTEEYPDVAALLEGAITVTRSMRDENRKLESRLAASTTEISHLRRNVESIQIEAMTDALTGVNNRNFFDKAIKEYMDAAKEKGRPMALVIADVDHFKKFNDRWGHQTGDQVLRLVAEVMRANLKGQDVLARYGGEEFAMILPGTTIGNARMLADRIRHAIESRRLKKRRTHEDLGVVTMSMGVAALNLDDTPDTLIERADACLYAAKNDGRNCVKAEGDIARSEQSRTDRAAS